MTGDSLCRDGQPNPASHSQRRSRSVGSQEKAFFFFDRGCLLHSWNSRRLSGRIQAGLWWQPCLPDTQQPGFPSSHIFESKRPCSKLAQKLLLHPNLLEHEHQAARSITSLLGLYSLLRNIPEAYLFSLPDGFRHRDRTVNATSTT